MVRQLVECPSCSRHVRVTEETCPFCRVAVPAQVRASVPRVRVAGRLSRAALFALGTATATAAGIACESEGEPEPEFVTRPIYGGPPVDQDAQPPLVDAAYGGPPIDSAPPLVDAAYGGPPIDGGVDAEPDAM